MIYILIPSYNDSDNFSTLLFNIAKVFKNKKFKVVIINDGSTDKTKEIISTLKNNYPVKLIGYVKNRGPGAAFKFGFNYIIPKSKDNDIVVTMEADNSSDFSILNDMVRATNKYDVVLSSPYAEGGEFIGLQKKRLILSYVSNTMDTIIFHIKNVRTFSSFYRAHRAKSLKKAAAIYRDNLITEDGFSAVVELLIKFNKLNFKICEIPAKLDWRSRRGKSKMKINKTIYRHIVLYRNYLAGKYDI